IACARCVSMADHLPVGTCLAGPKWRPCRPSLPLASWDSMRPCFRLQPHLDGDGIGGSVVFTHSIQLSRRCFRSWASETRLPAERFTACRLSGPHGSRDFPCFSLPTIKYFGWWWRRNIGRWQEGCLTMVLAGGLFASGLI